MHLAAASTSPRLERQVVAALAASLLFSFLAIVVVLVIRRLSGALVQPLSVWALIAAAASCAIATAVLRLALADFEPAGLRTEYSVLTTQYWLPWAISKSSALAINGLLFALPGIASLLLLATLTLPGSLIAGVLASWLLLIATEAASWVIHYRREPGGARNIMPRSPALLAESPPSNHEHEEEIPLGLVQQVTRVRQGDGESIHAMFAAEIPVGDNLAAIHLAFCPPLRHAPALTAHAVESEDATVKVTQAETFGARIEVRLPLPAAEARSVLVEILGSVRAAR